ENTQLHNVEKSQDRIPVEIATQIEGIQQTQHNVVHEDEDQPNDAQSQPL
ncbi:hypothetical protein A2U01_0090854, partial [Trifolium medium]|nr:hypothetical protein [Trifolium medium]